jgi:hypothetical protein
VGRFPSGTIDPAGLTHRFFPAGIDVALSFIPEDELPALIEESLLMPPIDLTVGVEGLSGTGVVVVLLLSRGDFESARSSLPNTDSSMPVIRPASLNLPRLAISRTNVFSRLLRPAPAAPDASSVEAWRTHLNGPLGQRLLWYVRRRNLPIAANVPGTSVTVTTGGGTDLARLADLIRADSGLKVKLARLGRLSVPEVNALIRRLAETRFIENPPLIKSLLSKAVPEGSEPKPEEALAALAVVADPRLGEGLARIEKANPELSAALRSDPAVEKGVLVDLDKLAREAPPNRLADLIRDLKENLAARRPVLLSDKVNDLWRKYIS